MITKKMTEIEARGKVVKFLCGSRGEGKMQRESEKLMREVLVWFAEIFRRWENSGLGEVNVWEGNREVWDAEE